MGNIESRISDRASGRRLIGLTAVSATLSGCGVTLNTHKVAEFKQKMNRPGIYWNSHPRTVEVGLAKTVF